VVKGLGGQGCRRKERVGSVVCSRGGSDGGQGCRRVRRRIGRVCCRTGERIARAGFQKR
jgi:hypothetical protein